MIKKRDDHTTARFLKRTVSAQLHLLTAFAAIFGLFFLAPRAEHAGPLHFWGTIVFGITAIMVFGISATYHFLHDGCEITPDLTEFMEKLDQWAIYLFIAGTYTPFLINVVASPWKEILMIGIWTMAITGILYTAFRHRFPQWAQSRFIYTSVFLVMGWALFIRIGEIFDKLPATPTNLLLAGAAAYSVGAVVYITKRPRLFVGFFGFHELWHVFVTVGFLCHFAMIASFYR
ncbi:MAG: hemolysin III family protein [Bdellovibrionota bacterium]